MIQGNRYSQQPKWTRACVTGDLDREARREGEVGRDQSRGSPCKLRYNQKLPLPLPVKECESVYPRVRDGTDGDVQLARAHQVGCSI